MSKRGCLPTVTLYVCMASVTLMSASGCTSLESEPPPLDKPQDFEWPDVASFCGATGAACKAIGAALGGTLNTCGDADYFCTTVVKTICTGAEGTTCALGAIVGLVTCATTGLPTAGVSCLGAAAAGALVC